MSAVRRSLFVAVISAVMGISSVASAESISGALAKAYQNNSSLNSARAGVRVTDEDVSIAKSGWRPAIGAVGSLTHSVQAGTSINTGSFGLQIQQSLFDGFQTLNNVRSAEARVRASNESLRNTVQNILFDAAAIYVDVIRDRHIADHVDNCVL